MRTAVRLLIGVVALALTAAPPPATAAEPALDDALRACIARETFADPDKVFTAAELAEVGVLVCYAEAGEPVIKELTGISALTNLKVLNLIGHQISDLRPLRGLTGLRELQLNDNRIVSLAGIEGLTGLELASLHGNRIADLKPLAGLTRLEHLGLLGNEIVDVSPLSGPLELEWLDLTSNRLSDVRPLAALPKGLRLGLMYNRITDISPLAGHTGSVLAARQQVELPTGVFGKPFPLTIKDVNGRTPTLRFSEGVSYRDGQLRHTYAGKQGVGFEAAGSGPVVFDGSIVQWVAPSQPFQLTPFTGSERYPSVGTSVQAYVGKWTPAPTEYRYQWYREKTPIPGATEEYYQTTSKDLGHRLRAQVTVTREGYIKQSRYTTYTGKVLRGSFATLSRPKITGSLKTGQTVTATVGKPIPAPSSLRYQWYRGSRKISGATKPSYTLKAADRGKRMSVRVTYKAPGITTEQVVSKKTAKVVAGPVRSVTPKITGKAAAGQRLRAQPGTWGPSKVTLRYQWRRDGKAIKGATSRSYRVTAKDGGHELSVAVKGSRKGYKTVTKVSGKVVIPA